MLFNDEAVSDRVLDFVDNNDRVIPVSDLLKDNEAEIEEKNEGRGINEEKDRKFDWKNEIIIIKNERRRKNLNVLAKNGETFNGVNTSSLGEEGKVKKSIELVSSGEYSRIGKTLVYHDSFKLLYENTNIHVEIPTVSDEKEDPNDTHTAEGVMEEIQQINNLSEYVNNHMKQWSIKNKHIFLNNINILTEILNYNYSSVWRNRDKKNIELFHHHDNFLMHILNLDENEKGENKKYGENTNPGESFEIEENNSGKNISVKKVPNMTCNHLCEMEREVEIREKDELKDTENSAGSSSEPFNKNGSKVPCMYNKIKQVECQFEPGNNYKFVYPHSHRGEKMRESHIPFSNILFDSKMESGNLLYVMKDKTKEKYYLYLNNDTRRDEKKNQWFYFSASYVPNEYFDIINKKQSSTHLKKKRVEDFLNEINKNLYLNSNETVRYSVDSSDKFCVKNVKKLKTPFTVRFQIMNMSKPNFLYKEGHSPLVFSKWRNKLENKTWERTAYNVKYTRNTAGKQFNIKKNCYESVSSHTYSLEFSYDFLYPYDTVYFSSSYPYTYSYLRQYLANIKSYVGNSKTICYREEVLCKTNCGLECPILAVTNFEKKGTIESSVSETDKESEQRGNKRNYSESSRLFEKDKRNEQSSDEFMQEFPNLLKKDILYESKKRKVLTAFVDLKKASDFFNVESEGKERIQKKEKRIIWVSARVHPGESNSSYAMHGFLSFIISDNIYANVLRDNFIFIIIPMLNVDGVMLGNNRCCSNGFDLNRQWYKPIMCLHATIYAAKALIKKVSSIYKIGFFCDFHGHSTKYNCFLFGNAGSNVFIKDKKLNHIFPRILAESIPWYALEDTKFKVEPESKGIARIICGKELNIICSYTLEMSLVGIKVKRKLNFFENMKRDVFSEDNWEMTDNKVETKTTERHRKRKQAEHETEWRARNLLGREDRKTEQSGEGYDKEESENKDWENAEKAQAENGKHAGTNNSEKIENGNKLNLLNGVEGYDFHYYNENMYIWTGIGLGISLFKFMNFLNYYSPFIYEIGEEKECSLSGCVTNNAKSIKTPTSEEQNVAKKKTSSGTVLSKGVKCNDIEGDIQKNKAMLKRKTSDNTDLQRERRIIGKTSLLDFESSKVEKDIEKSDERAGKRDEQSESTNRDKRRSMEKLQIKKGKMVCSISDNEYRGKVGKATTGLNKGSSVEKRRVFKLKKKEASNASSYNMKKNNTSAEKTGRCFQSIEGCTKRLVRSVTENGINHYTKGNKILVSKNTTGNNCYLAKIHKVNSDAFYSEGVFLGECRKETSNKKESLPINPQKKEKKCEIKKIRNETKKKCSGEKKGKGAVHCVVMKNNLHHLSDVESSKKIKSVTKDKTSRKTKITALKLKKETSRNASKTSKTAALPGHMHSIIMCKRRKKHNPDLQEGKLEGKSSSSKRRCESRRKSSFVDTNINSNNVQSSSTCSSLFTSISSNSGSNNTNNVRENDMDNRKESLEKAEAQANGKKLEITDQRKRSKETKFTKSRKSKNISRPTRNNKNDCRLKLKETSGKEKKRKTNVQVKNRFSFHNKYKLDYTKNGLKMRLRPRLNRNVKEVIIKNHNKMKSKFKKKGCGKKGTSILWKWKQYMETGVVGDEYIGEQNNRHKQRLLEKYLVDRVSFLGRKKIRLRISPPKKHIKAPKGGISCRDGSKDEGFNRKGKEKRARKGKTKR